jgi:hypothetical protein
MNKSMRYPRTRLEAFPQFPDDTYHRADTTPHWVRVAGRIAFVTISLSLGAAAVCGLFVLFVGVALR